MKLRETALCANAQNPLNTQASTFGSSTHNNTMSQESIHSMPDSLGGLLSPNSATKVVLEVGERRFVTTRQTLARSTFFSALLSGRWDNQQEDGSYFIDADPDLFEHILRFLRRGTLPLFYDKSKGHDYGLYHALLAEARYFGIDALENWLVDRGYEKMVKVTLLLESFEYSSDDDLLLDQLRGNVTTECHPRWYTKKVYVCPRGIRVHRGIPSACGRECHRVQGDREDEYTEEPACTIVVVQRETTINEQACLEDRYL